MGKLGNGPFAEEVLKRVREFVESSDFRRESKDRRREEKHAFASSAHDWILNEVQPVLQEISELPAFKESEQVSAGVRRNTENGVALSITAERRNASLSFDPDVDRQRLRVRESIRERGQEFDMVSEDHVALEDATPEYVKQQFKSTLERLLSTEPLS